MILPPWADHLRPQQLFAIQQILKSFASGDKIVMLDAPTGSGKTLIAEMVRQSLDCRAVYLCSTLSLQNQFYRDFPNAAVLYGRSNYGTADNTRHPELTAADCDKETVGVPACKNCPETVSGTLPHCHWCHPVTACPYERAKAAAIRADLVCTNSYYFLYESNYVGNIALGRKLVIIDEADTIEDIIMSFASVKLTPKQQRDYNLPKPEKKTVESAWVEWAENAEKSVYKYLHSSSCRGNDLQSIRNRIRTSRLLTNIKRLNDPDTGLAAGGWVYTGYDVSDIAFKPVRIDNLAEDVLFRHCDKFLLMSATMISFHQLAESLGVSGDDN